MDKSTIKELLKEAKNEYKKEYKEFCKTDCSDAMHASDAWDMTCGWLQSKLDKLEGK